MVTSNMKLKYPVSNIIKQCHPYSYHPTIAERHLLATHSPHLRTWWRAIRSLNTAPGTRCEDFNWPPDIRVRDRCRTMGVVTAWHDCHDERHSNARPWRSRATHGCQMMGLIAHGILIYPLFLFLISLSN